jgi:hypothetical protein
MSFDQQDAARMVLNNLTDVSSAQVNLQLPKIYAIIPVALEMFVRECMGSWRWRELLKKQVTVDVASGIVDLAPYIDGTDEAISLGDLRNTTLYLASMMATSNPAHESAFQWCASLSQLQFGARIGGGISGDEQPACFLEGTRLFTRNTDGSLTSLNGSNLIKFTVPVYPQTTETLPVSMQGHFIDFAAKYVRKELELVKEEK